MIFVNKETLDVTIPSGDTGTLIYTFRSNNSIDGRVVKFTVKYDSRKNNTPLIQKQAIIENGRASFNFQSQDTQDATIGIYKYDIRITGQGNVDTPKKPMRFEIVQVVGSNE